MASTWKLSEFGAILLLVLAFPHGPALAQDRDAVTPVPATAPPTASEPAAPAASTAQVPGSAAPDSAPPAPTAPRRRASGRYTNRPTLDDRIAVLSKNLELTEAQRSAVKNILVRRQEQMLRIRASDVPGGVRIGQFRALQDNTVTQIRAVLNDEQKKKYDPMMVRRVPEPSTPQRSVEDWIKATSPH